MKMRLNNDYSIAFPIAVCEPLNAKLNWRFKTPLIAGRNSILISSHIK